MRSSVFELALPSPLSRRALAFGLLIAGALAVAALALLIDASHLFDAIAEVLTRPELLVPFLALYTAAFWLRAAAWGRLLNGARGTFDLFSILQTSMFVNHVLPAKAGDAARVFLLNRRGSTAGAALSSTAVARIIDFSALLAIAAASGLIAAGRTPAATTLLVPLLLMAAGLLALVLLAGPWSETVLTRVPHRAGTFLGDARAALRQIRARPLSSAIGLTGLSWLLEAVVLVVAAEALGVEISPAEAIAVTSLVVALQAIQVTPGGLGTYEAAMTGALAAYGVDASMALLLATTTHGLKFLYSYAVGGLFAAREALSLPGRSEGASAKGARGAASASPIEIVAARLWNVLNEGKTFTPVFVVSIFVGVNFMRWTDSEFWLRGLLALALAAPLFLTFYRYDFPLRLRAFLWVILAAFLLVFRFFDPVASAAFVGAYFFFTVILWGSLYYHLRIGTPLSNFTRFWRLVLENSDSTSGNFLEQSAKGLLLVNALQYAAGMDHLSFHGAMLVFGFGETVALVALLTHQWFFRWRPAYPTAPTSPLSPAAGPLARRVIAIVIDGCRADRLREARTPVLDRLRAEGTEFADMRTVYPARTVTCFSSMLTGAPPRVHGMRSNFVPSLGVKCDSVFTLLRRNGRLARLVGIAHLVDAFGEDVRTVTAVMNNEEIDGALLRLAQRVLVEEDPTLLVLQLISVDQTGHARGSYNGEYLTRIEATDALIGEFTAWLEERGLLEGTTLLVTSDHGQGRGIGGHGHLGPGELQVPCIFWGAGVARGRRIEEARSIIDIAPTIACALGLPPPEDSVGCILLPPAAEPPEKRDLVAVVIPAHNEAENLRAILARVPSPEQAGTPLRVVVVDDGSTDATAAVARAMGAEVISHERTRGLGAALRTGLHRARDLGAKAAVYIDSDGEYDPREIPRVLAPVLSGDADYVLGSRFKRGWPAGMRPLRRAGNLVLTAALSFLAGRLISDGQTGFRAFGRTALEVAEIVHDFNYAQVLTLDLLRKGMRLAEVPVSYTPRVRGRSFVRYHQYAWRVIPAIVREVLGD